MKMEAYQYNHEDQKDNRKQVEEEVKSQQRVCEICFKEFSSGKALGGHKSSAHSQGNGQKIKSCSKKSTKRKYNNNKDEESGDSYDGFPDEFDDEDDGYYCSQKLIGKLGSKKRKFGFTCSYCDKDFPSKKYLFEHMRCHPDRPDTEEVEQEEAGIRNQENGIPSNATPAPVVDLAQGLAGLRWFKKGIRGSSSSAMVDKSDSTSYNNGLHEDSDDESGGSKSNLGDDEAATIQISDGTGFFLDDAMSKKTTKISDEQFRNEEAEAAGVMNQPKNKGKSTSVFENGRDGGDANSSDDELVRKLNYDRKGKNVEKKKEKTKSNNPKKIIIRMGKLSSSSVGDAADHHVISPPSEAAPSHPPPPPPPSQPLGGNKGFRCSSCGKIFTTHQALGGHRSSHNKFRMNIHNTIDDEVLPLDPPSMEDKFSSKGRRICKIEKKKAATTEEVRKVFDFDLNQLPEEGN